MVVGEGEDAMRVPGDIWHQLFEHQREGVRWLWGHFQAGRGAILGDDMGLGKTMQVVALVAGLWYSDVRRARRGAVLIVAPATVVDAWVAAFHEWMAPVRVYLLHVRGRWPGSRADLLDLVYQRGGVVVTTYAQLRRHADLVCRQPWLLAVLDEGHKIRNPDSQVAQAAKNLKTPHRYILTGTPIQNRLMELWSMMDFVCPGRLGTAVAFKSGFAHPIAVASQAKASLYQIRAAFHRARALKALLHPYLLRRLRKNTALELPGREDHVLLVQPSALQCTLYDAYLSSEGFRTYQQTSQHGTLSAVHVLRRICNHPQLLRVWTPSSAEGVRGVDRRVARASRVWAGSGHVAWARGVAGASAGAFDRLEQAQARAQAPARGRAPALSFVQHRFPGAKRRTVGTGRSAAPGPRVCCGIRLTRGWWAEPAPWARAHLAGVPVPRDLRELPGHSAKVQVLGALLEAWHRAGDRVLVFAQALQVLDLLEAWMRACGWSVLRFDGTTPVGLRRAHIQTFNRADGPFLLLLTTRVGGLGLNLARANRVVLFELDWNPSADRQACGRAWRIGQTRTVQIYRLAIAGSVEEEILRYQVFKEYLSHKVLRNARHRKLLQLRSAATLLRPLQHRPPPTPADGRTMAYHGAMLDDVVVTDVPLSALQAQAGEGTGAGPGAGLGAGGEPGKALLRRLAVAAQERGGNILQELVDDPSLDGTPGFPGGPGDGDGDGDGDGVGDGAGPAPSHPERYDAWRLTQEAREQAWQAARRLRGGPAGAGGATSSTGLLHSMAAYAVAGADLGLQGPSAGQAPPQTSAAQLVQWFQIQPRRAISTQTIIQTFRHAVQPGEQEAFRRTLHRVARFDAASGCWALRDSA